MFLIEQRRILGLRLQHTGRDEETLYTDNLFPKIMSDLLLYSLIMPSHSEVRIGHIVAFNDRILGMTSSILSTSSACDVSSHLEVTAYFVSRLPRAWHPTRACILPCILVCALAGAYVHTYVHSGTKHAWLWAFS